LLGCEMSGEVVAVDGAQETSIVGVYAAGEPTGNTGMEAALVEGAIAGFAVAGQGGSAAVERLRVARARHRRFAERAAAAFRLRPELRERAESDTIVCRCEDVPRSAIRDDWDTRETKLATRAGMGSCQGRVCGPAIRHLRGGGAAADTVRVPVVPTPLGVLMELAATHDHPRGAAE